MPLTPGSGARPPRYSLLDGRASADATAASGWRRARRCGGGTRDDGAPLGDAGDQLLGRGDRDRQRGDVDADLGAQRQRRPGQAGQALHQGLQRDAERAPTSVVAASTLLGSYSYQLPDWPDANELISFPFRYLATGQHVEPRRRRAA